MAEKNRVGRSDFFLKLGPSLPYIFEYNRFIHAMCPQKNSKRLMDTTSGQETVSSEP